MIARGTLEIRVTDAPPQLNVTHINVKLTDIGVNSSDSNSGWVTVLAGPMEFDLLQLKASGVASILGQTELGAGHYSQVRMDVELVSAEIDGNTVTTGIEVPSGMLRLVTSFEIQDGKTTILTIDFDAASVPGFHRGRQNNLQTDGQAICRVSRLNPSRMRIRFSAVNLR